MAAYYHVLDTKGQEDAAEANLKNSRTQLRQDVMLNPYGTFLPEEIQPLTRPNPQEQIVVDEERALQLAVEAVERRADRVLRVLSDSMA